MNRIAPGKRPGSQLVDVSRNRLLAERRGNTGFENTHKEADRDNSSKVLNDAVLDCRSSFNKVACGVHVHIVIWEEDEPES